MEKNLNNKNNQEKDSEFQKKEEVEKEYLEDIFLTEEECEIINEILDEEWLLNERIDEIERNAFNDFEQGIFLSLLEETQFEKMFEELKEREIRESIVTETELENAIVRKKQAKKTFEYITWSSYILGWFLLFFLQFIWRMRFIDYMVFLTSLWSHALFICFISSQTYPQTVPLETYEEVLYGGINVKTL
jgi:hypothetical protein